MNRYSVTAEVALVSVLGAIGTGMYILHTRPSDAEVQVQEKLETEVEVPPRPILQQLEVVEPEDTPYTKEELEEIFR